MTARDAPISQPAADPFTEIMRARPIRREELRRLIPLADTTIYEMEQRGEFPKRFYLTSRCAVWDLREVLGWLDTRRKDQTPAVAHPDVSRRRARPVRRA